FLLPSLAYPVAATHTLLAGCASGAILFRCWPQEPRGSRRLIGRNSVSRYELLAPPREPHGKEKEQKGRKGNEKEPLVSVRIKGRVQHFLKSVAQCCTS